MHTRTSNAGKKTGPYEQKIKKEAKNYHASAQEVRHTEKKELVSVARMSVVSSEVARVGVLVQLCRIPRYVLNSVVQYSSGFFR